MMTGRCSEYNGHRIRRAERCVNSLGSGQHGGADMSKRTCSIEDCERPVDARGWCPSHYARWRRLGDPEAPLTRASPGEPLRFLRSVVEDPPDQCVLWPYATGARGYARIRHEGETTAASRLALELHSGPPPSQKHHAAHAPLICHEPMCVNPLHLRWATPTENIEDRRIDRTNHRGEDHPMSKLTELAVHAIRADARPSDEIASEYQIHPQTVNGIKRGVTWRWLK